MLSFAESSDGVVLMVDGITPALRWDGYTTSARAAGVVAPATAATVAGGGVGTITGTYYAYVRYVDDAGNYSDLSPVSAAATVTGVDTITYTNVPVPQQASVVTRQILRNTAGQTDTFYVDVETSDLGSTTFSSTRVDTDLATQQAVVAAEEATIYGVPPANKPFVCYHQNRMYLAGVEVYREGSCEVAQGSATVTGRGTEWKATFAGRYFHTSGGGRPYLISSCDPVAQTLTLSEGYGGTTDLFAAYAVKPAPAEANTFYWSQPLLPEAWDPADGLSLAEDGDDVTGMFNYQSFLYFIKRRHLYRLTTRNDPALDGLVSLACRRGCVNERCVVVADEVAYLLDEGGVYAYKGDDQGEPVSTQIQDMFRSDLTTGLKINMQASRYFHACHSPMEETIRWYVALAGDYLPRHALCFNYKQSKWWIEKLPVRAGSSVLGKIGNAAGDVTAGVAQYFVGSSADTVLAPGTAALDGNPVGGTVRGSPTAAGPCSLTDATASFGADAVGCPVAIADGRGLAQVRVVVAVTGSTRLELDRPWRVTPDTASVYVLGGIPWEWRTQRLRWQPSEAAKLRFGEIEFVPNSYPNKSRVELLPDFSPSMTNRYPIDGGQRPGTTATPDDRGQVIDLTRVQGFEVVRGDGHREGMNAAATGRVTRLAMSGVSGEEQARFGTILVAGALG